MRKASPADVPLLVTMMAEFYAEGGYPLNRRHAAEGFAALLKDDRLGHVWLIRSASQDVGHIVVTCCFSMEYGGLIAFVDDLFVQKAFRRQGLGEAALKEVRGFCASQGIRAMFVETGEDNTAARAVYRGVGFVDTERQLLMLNLAEATHIGG